MEFDKRTILAFLLIGLILIFLQTDFYKKNFLPPPQPPQEIEAPVPIPEKQEIQTKKELSFDSLLFSSGGSVALCH